MSISFQRPSRMMWRTPWRSLFAAGLAMAVFTPAVSQTEQRTLGGLIRDGLRLATGQADPEAIPEFDARVLLAPTPASEIRADIWFLPDAAASLEAAPAEGETRLVITGAYSSGDRFAPEGFVIRDGDPTHPYAQGWDGLLTVTADGRATLHNVGHVQAAGRRFNLRDIAGRDAFVAHARKAGLSAIQSHLLISDGVLDVRPSANARRFRRRLLFQTPDGRLGVYDTGKAALTLYQAGAALMRDFTPRMALNLDMGDYDYCEKAEGAKRHRCGWLSLGHDERLTNLIVLNWRAND